MQSLLPAERDTLNRPDFRPLINPDFVENPVNPAWPLSQACADCLHLESISLPQPGGGEPNIRREDVEDFRNTWVRSRPWEIPEANSISGYWTVGDQRSSILENAILLVQYKTFRVCVQVGPTNSETLISTEEISHLLDTYLGQYQGDLLPPVVAYSIFDTTAFQFLIIPEPVDILRDSIERFNDDDTADDESHIMDPSWTMENLDQETITLGEVTLTAIDNFRAGDYFRHLQDAAHSAWMDNEHVLSDRADKAGANVALNRNFH
ncbi:hypothetical protein DHEL01_v212749 [Diaporthe helianthi]|uniref:Uncharacterized protein n=1 Tax=Diaporthe helianthi TaxID=158607 RepID=A0A2P5HF42_DIAHE|nr:hypothetical protein DHEL01_v212749 [Diaporthe helianthi]